ncbi:MAG TPA: type I restriction enzyme HsdR N-terminal domain-containing protein [Candidatus Saccharimonadales bacterium]
MPTAHQRKTIESELREYRKRYLRKEFSKLDESATRIMVNSLLSEVLGYKELEEIKTEYRIRGEYADYVIQTKRKKRFVVEVKSIQLDLDDRHLRQSMSYAANEGVDWILLLNGRSAELYRVIFGKPMRNIKVFSYDLTDLKQIKKVAESFAYLSKQSVNKGELEAYWKKFEALADASVTKLLYSEEVALYLRRQLKKETGLYFDLEEICVALERVIMNSMDVNLRYKKK